MDILLKGSAFALTVIVLYQMLSGRNKEIGTLLVVVGSSVILVMAIMYMSPIFQFFEMLQTIGNLNHEVLSILFKSVAIGFLTEISVLVCNDMGNTSVGKTLQILSTVLILRLALPLLNSLLDLISGIMGEL